MFANFFKKISLLEPQLRRGVLGGSGVQESGVNSVRIYNRRPTHGCLICSIVMLRIQAMSTVTGP